ncbi:19525_t:CDS:2 [Gigaspora margarita]|uniref:19525_t:CDS:1 n=1 Tax=Gigaspora margarita TaxID=4874 RepID=A0ABM8W185_GIGMA|nr:19525_t:CDS:2 [Gigaspora margarita]
MAQHGTNLFSAYPPSIWTLFVEECHLHVPQALALWVSWTGMNNVNVGPYAIAYTLYKDVLVLSGYYRGPAQKSNGEKCRYLEGLKSNLCEDIKIHHASGLAYLACGDEQSRKTAPWPPPIDAYNNSLPLRGNFYVYDIEKDKLTPLILKNFPDEEDFSLHGFGIYESPTESDNLYFFIINHKRTGSVIELFQHKLKTFELNHLKTFKHDLIYSPNSVAPVSKDEFYITNDLYYIQSHWKVQFEIWTRRKWSNVVFHSSKTNTTEIVVDGLMIANGITVNWDYSRVFIGTSGTGELFIYERKPDNKLKLLDTIDIEHPVDNVNVDPVTGEIYLAVIHDILEYMNGLADKFQSIKPSFGVIKISNNTKEDKFYGIKYAKEKIFEDDGTLFYALSVAAGDSSRKVMLWGSPFAEGVVRCELN